MFNLKTLMLALGLLALGAQAQADTVRSENQPNVLDQKCENAERISIRVVNMDGQCQAFWKCNDLTFSVSCDGGQCACQHEALNFANKISYEACDSDKLKACFNLVR